MSGGENVGLGYNSAQGLTTGVRNTILGSQSGQNLTTGSDNILIGYRTVYNATSTGSNNVAVGSQSLYSNTTSSSNTAVGYQSLYSNTTGTSSNEAFGREALRTNTTGGFNQAFGNSALYYNTTGSYNVAMGTGSLQSNTTASNNTAVGYQAGYTNSTGAKNVYIGTRAGNVATGSNNTIVGEEAGLALSTGTGNTFIGAYNPSQGGCGEVVTTGSKNTIIGAYTGNQGGLDIRTASNTVVLSDGDGNPVMQVESTGYTVIGYGTRGADGGVLLMGSATSGQGPCLNGFTGAYGARTSRWYAGSNSFVKGGTTYDTYTVMAGSTGGVNLTNGATSWTSASDERLKDIIEPITDATNKVSQLRAVIGKYKTDEEGKRRSFLIAQDVQAVLPEAVSEGRESKEDETAYLQVSYTDVIPLLVAAIKELKAEFDAYKASHP